MDNIDPYFLPYSPRLYRGFTITHEDDGYWRVYSGVTQRGWARRLKQVRNMIDDYLRAPDNG